MTARVVTGGKPRPGITVGLVFRLYKPLPRYANGSFDAGMKLDGQFSGGVVGAFDVTSSPRDRNCYEDYTVLPLSDAVVGLRYTVSYLLGSGPNSSGSGVSDPSPLTTKLYLHGHKAPAEVTQELRSLGCFA
jgi:hypothetical protein